MQRARLLARGLPQFSAVAMLPFKHHVADDDAAADAGAEGEEHHAVRAFACADPVFAIGGGVGVVLKGSRHLELALDMPPDRNIFPRT